MNIFEQLLSEYVKQLNLYPAKANNRTCGCSYEGCSTIGKGSFWTYFHKNSFMITKYDYKLYKDVEVHYHHPDVFVIGSFNLPLVQYIRPNQPSLLEAKENRLLGYTLREGEFCETLKKESLMLGISISMSSAFIDELCKKFDIRKDIFTNIFFTFDNEYINTEAQMIFYQLYTVSPIPKYAYLYYESKIIELISVILSWKEKKETTLKIVQITDEDRLFLKKVTDYLHNHYAEVFDMKQMEVIACMGKNKLSYLFKYEYGTTITQFLQNIRIQKAKKFLNDYTLSIKDVANTVGYTQASFSVVFKQYTGLTPTEYRKQFCYN